MGFSLEWFGQSRASDDRRDICGIFETESQPYQVFRDLPNLEIHFATILHWLLTRSTGSQQQLATVVWIHQRRNSTPPLLPSSVVMGERATTNSGQKGSQRDTYAAAAAPDDVQSNPT